MTSSSSQSSPDARLPARTLAWIAAPSATTWSGSRLLSGGCPKKSPTAFWICGIRVDPPTITTPWMSAGVSPASRNARFTGPSVFATRCAVICVNVSALSAISTLVPSDSVALIVRGRVQRQVLLRLARLHHQQPRVLGRQRRQAGGFQHPAMDTMVEVVAAKRRVAIRREHFEHAARELEDRDVERAAAQIVDRVGALRCVVETVGDRRRRRLVQEPQHVETRELRGILGRLPLRIVEIRGHRDHRAGELAREARLGANAQRAQDLGRDFDRALHAGAGARASPSPARR